MKKIIKSPEHPLVFTIEGYVNGKDWYAIVGIGKHHEKIGPCATVKKIVKAARITIESVLISHAIISKEITEKDSP